MMDLCDGGRKSFNRYVNPIVAELVIFSDSITSFRLRLNNH